MKKTKFKKAADNPEVMQYVNAGWIPVLQTGKITDSAGNEHDFTSEKLDAIAAAYDPEMRKAPLVLGHPKTDSPAYGWAASLKRVGDFLLALPEKVDSEFKKMVNAGRYMMRSVALKGDELRHIGFLGGAQPACPGLGDVSLAELQGDLEIEFSMPSDPNDPDWDLAWKIRDVGEALRRFREYVIEKEGLEQADKVLPNYLIDRLTQDPQPPKSTYTEGEIMDPKDKKITELTDEVAGLKTQVGTKTTELATATARVTELETQLTDRDNAAWNKTRDDFVAGLQRKGIILAAKVPEAKGMLDSAREAGKGEFAEDKNPALKRTMDFMRSQKPQLPAEEIARLNQAEDPPGASPASEAIQLSEAAQAYIQTELTAGRKVDPATAVAHVKSLRNRR